MRIPGIPYRQGRNNYSDRDGMHYGIAIHNTSNDASDEAEASYASRRTDGISSHLYCDGDSVTQSLDLSARAGHAGSAIGNDNAIAVEITGGNGWSRAQWLANVAWDKLGAALAWVIRNDPDFAGFQVRRASVAEMKANPKVKAFYGHNDMRLAWGDTTHTDPGPNFPWDRLFEAVNQALHGTTPAPTPQGDAELNADESKKLADIHYTLTAGPHGAEHTRWNTLMQVVSQQTAVLTAIAKAQGVAQADLDAIEARVGTVELTDEQVTAIADRLIASGANGLTEADHAGVVADVKQALREGTAG